MFCQIQILLFLRDLEQTTDLVTVLKSHAHGAYVVGSSQLLEGYSGFPLTSSSFGSQMQGGG